MQADSSPTQPLRRPIRLTCDHRLHLPRKRSCFTLLKSAPSRLELMVKLYQNRVPKILIDYIADSAQIVNNDNNGNFDERKSEHKLHDSMETNLNTAN